MLFTNTFNHSCLLFPERCNSQRRVASRQHPRYAIQLYIIISLCMPVCVCVGACAYVCLCTGMIIIMYLHLLSVYTPIASFLSWHTSKL